MTQRRPTPHTHDEHELTTAAYLKARGFRLTGVVEDPARPRHKLFRFADDGRIADAVMDFYNGAVVPARDFAGAISELKSLVYQGRGGPAR